MGKKHKIRLSKIKMAIIKLLSKIKPERQMYATEVKYVT